jgi:hypothetical protein
MPPRPTCPHTIPREAVVSGFRGSNRRINLTHRDLGRIASAFALGVGVLWACAAVRAQDAPASPSADVATPSSDIDLMERARRELARRLQERAEETQALLERARRELAEQLSEGFAQIAPESQSGPESTGSLVISPDRSRARAAKPSSLRSNPARLLDPAPLGESRPPLPPNPDFDPQLFEQWARIEPPRSLDWRAPGSEIAPPAVVTVPLLPPAPPAEDHIAALPPLEPALAFPSLPTPEEAPVAVIAPPEMGRVAPPLPPDAGQAPAASVPSSTAPLAPTLGTEQAPVAAIPPIEAPTSAPTPVPEQAPVAALPSPPPMEVARPPPEVAAPADAARRIGPVRVRPPATLKARGRIQHSAPSPARPPRIRQAHRGNGTEFTLRPRNRKEAERPPRAPARTAQSQPARATPRVQKARSTRVPASEPAGIPLIILPNSLLPTLPSDGSPL